MARPRNQDARRRELVAVTSRLLIDRGIAGARLTDIAAAAGCTAAAVSYYYPDLVQLYSETYATVTSEYVTKRRELVMAEVGAIQRLRECLRLGVPMRGESSFDATKLLVELSLLEWRAEGVARSSAAEFEREQLELFGEVLEQGVASGVFTLFRSVPATARAILALEDGLADPVIAGRVSSEESLGIMLDVVSEFVGTRLD